MWRLEDEGLNVDVRVTNRTRQRTPFDLTVSVELSPVGDQVQALIPAEDFVMDGASQPVTGSLDLRRPKSLDEPLFAEFTRRHFANLRTSAAVLAPASHREVWFLNSADFKFLRVRLDTHGGGFFEAHTGQRSLAPGEEWRGSATLTAITRHTTR
jgi:hypothetical protein